jgi:manganese/zinc/iron transport system permease protein
MTEFWELTVRFFSLADANVRWVVAGAVLLGAAAGALGSFVYLQKKSLVGDSVAHSALPGVALAFLIIGYKDTLGLLIGASIAGWIGALIVNALVRSTKLKQDAALGIVLTSLFGLGIVLLTYIQRTGSGAQSGLDKFLFGQAAALSRSDVTTLGVVAALLLILLAVGFRQFKIISFDPGYARAVGLRVAVWQVVLTTMIVLSVTVGLQAVGVVLMAAMLITPAASARQWTDKLHHMVWLSAVFGGLSGLAGAWVSFLAPRWPTGPWMVVMVTAIFALSITLAPSRGVVARLWRYWRQRIKTTREHVLKELFKPGLESRNWSRAVDLSTIFQRVASPIGEIRHSLWELRRRGLLERVNGKYRLTDGGVVEGARVLRLHRLWELYLTRFLDLPEDHVHRDAEEIEHIITPEMEARLEALLGKPSLDPHAQEIPYIGRETSS